MAGITQEILIKLIQDKLEQKIGKIPYSERFIDNSELSQVLENLGIDTTFLETKTEPGFEELNSSYFEYLFPGSLDFFLDEDDEIREGMEDNQINWQNFPTDLKVISGIVIVTYYDELDLEKVEKEIGRTFTQAELESMPKKNLFTLQDKTLIGNFIDTQKKFEIVYDKYLLLTLFEEIEIKQP